MNRKVSNQDFKHVIDNAPNFAELHEFPGWEKVGNFIQKIIITNNSKSIGDVGGGRLPRIGLDFLRQHGLGYYLFDISAAELAQADNQYIKIEMNVCCNESDFSKARAPENLDLIFSHMLLEHLPDPLQAHRNFFKMLRPGGLSVHLFPSNQNLPLFVNRLIPEKISYAILKKLQPHRNTSGEEGKFEAYYHLCGAPSQKLRTAYESVGFEVLQHTSYVGHEYYRRIKPLAAIEKKLRPLLVKMKAPMISANLLILRKPLGS